MGERPIVNVASAPTSLMDDMEWSRQYADTHTGVGPTTTAIGKLASNEMLPIPARATGVVVLRAMQFGSSVAGSIAERIFK